jgi:hypothetical protein
MTDMAPPDMGSIDLGPFFKRYDRRNRLVLGTAISASLVLSAVIAARLLAAGWTSAKPVAAAWQMGVAFPPLAIAAWWTFAEFIAWGRRKASQPRQSAGADDASNGMRVANAGFVFNLGLAAALVLQQASMALFAFGYPTGDLIPRVTTVAVGAVTIYLGNLWPRMPTPRAPERQAAIAMKTHRVIGWIMVIVGLLIVLLGLFLPLLYPWMRHRR